MRVSIMQPAFVPPASYFRLFAASDIFVILDNVQFDRRWYTHRQKLTDHDGEKEWLTLPIKKTPRDTTMIRDLEWQDTSLPTWYDNNAGRFSVLNKEGTIQSYMYDAFLGGDHSPYEIVTALLDLGCREIGITCEVEYSGDMEIDRKLKGQDRIVALCKELGATEYLNSPGGRDLYNEEKFSREGIKLTFLPEYKGNMDSILERLACEKPENIRKEIMENL